MGLDLTIWLYRVAIAVVAGLGAISTIASIARLA